MKKVLRVIFGFVVVAALVSVVVGVFMMFWINAKNYILITATPTSALMTVFGAVGLVAGWIGYSICSPRKKSQVVSDWHIANVPLPDLKADKLCPNCLAVNNPLDPFCTKCWTPLTSYAEIGPLERALSIGDMFYKIMHKRTNKVALWSVLIYFGVPLLVLVPTLFALIVMTLMRVSDIDSEELFISIITILAIGFCSWLCLLTVIKTIKRFGDYKCEEAIEETAEEEEE